MAEIHPQVREFIPSAPDLAPNRAGMLALTGVVTGTGLIAGAAYNQKAKQEWDNPDARVVDFSKSPERVERMGYLVFNHGGNLESAAKMSVAWSHMEGRPFATVVQPDYGRWREHETGGKTEQEAIAEDIGRRGAEDVTIVAPSYGFHRALHWDIPKLRRIDADCPVVDFSDYIDQEKKELVEKIRPHQKLYEFLANPLLGAAIAFYNYKGPDNESFIEDIINRASGSIKQARGKGTSPVGYVEDLLEFSATTEEYGEALIRDFRNRSPNVEVNVFHPLSSSGDKVADGPRVVSRLIDGGVPTEEYLIPGGDHVINERSAGEYMRQASLGGLEQSPRYAAELAVANFRE